MYGWLRRVTPDLFLASLIALFITLALHQLEAYESERMIADATAAARDGLTFDERISVVGDSIRRSTRLYVPLLVVFGGASVGLVCRLKKWAWLTSLLATIPALLIAAGFYIDLPLRVAAMTASYVVLGTVVAHAVVAFRRRVVAAWRARTEVAEPPLS
jgi:hypothetical protein